MHVAMLNDHVGIDQAQENKGLLQDVYRYQEELRAIYTMELLKKQVDLEEEAEMKAFLLQY